MALRSYRGLATHDELWLLRLSNHFAHMRWREAREREREQTFDSARLLLELQTFYAHASRWPQMRRWQESWRRWRRQQRQR